VDVELTAQEVLDIADKIERNGARFYRKAAVLCDHAETSRLFVKLAQWEARHVEIFRRMKEELAKQSRDVDRVSLEQRNGADAAVLAGLAVFGIRPDPADELTGRETRADIVRTAIEKEKDSIVYYTGLKDFVPRDADKETVGNIIGEEMKHVRILIELLQQET
jgi:rubrerythrin